MREKDDTNVIREFYQALATDEERETAKKLLRMDKKRREEVVETLIADHLLDIDDITKKVLLGLPPMTRKDIAQLLAEHVRTGILGGISTIVEGIAAFFRRWV